MSDNTHRMNRFDLMQRMVARLRNEEAVIGGIGHTNFDLWSAGHRPQNFYMLGSMGLAVLARPDVAQRYRVAGVPVVPEVADGLKARVAREVPLWREVIRQAKIAVE